MEQLGPEYFFPGIPTLLNKWELEASLQHLVPNELKTTSPNEDELITIDSREEHAFDWQRADYPDELHHVVPKSIQKGHHFDVISLLSSKANDTDTTSTDYLIRTSNGARVEVESLRGKYIMLCCFLVPSYTEGNFFPQVQAISLASHDLALRNDFEMVLVLKMRPHWAHDESAFQHFLSAFSCLAVPFDQPLRRDFICKYLNLNNGLHKGLFVDPNQVVVRDTVDFLRFIGANAFPYTAESLRSYSLETWEGQCLEGLLGCNPSDYLCKNSSMSEKVQVYELKEKVVGLYLCITGREIPVVEKVYQHCRDKGLDFEIILAYIPFCGFYAPEVFQDVINWVLEKRNISWWVLPFHYSVCSRLYRLSGISLSDQLVIVTPHDELVDCRGLQVIDHVGMEAYPFTREHVVKTTLHKLEQHSLESILEGGVLQRRNSDGVVAEVCLADLRGRSILLYVGWAEKTLHLYSQIYEFYGECKGKYPDAFEVVFVCTDKCLSNKGNESLSSMPWPVLHPSPSIKEFVKTAFFIRGFKQEKLIAYGKDFRVRSLNGHHLLKSYGSCTVPFCSDLLNEIISDLDIRFERRFMRNMVWTDSFLKAHGVTTHQKAEVLSSSAMAQKTIQVKKTEEYDVGNISSADSVCSRVWHFIPKIGSHIQGKRTREHSAGYINSVCPLCGLELHLLPKFGMPIQVKRVKRVQERGHPTQ